MRLFTPLLLMSSSVCAVNIDGTWLLDLDKTIEFNNSHTNQSPLEKTLLSCSNERLTFAKGIATTEIKDYKCAYNNKSTIIEGMKHTWQYKIIGNTVDSIALKAQKR